MKFRNEGNMMVMTSLNPWVKVCIAKHLGTGV